jgi:hypothetical protein
MEKTHHFAIFIATAVLAVMGPGLSLQAGITNGNFSQGDDGLSGWTVVSGDPNQLYTDSGYAVMDEEENNRDPILFFQNFNVESQDDRLLFDLTIASVYSDETDHFNAYLYADDGDGTPHDAFYSWNSDDGKADFSEPVSLDLTSFQGGRAYLIFEFLPDGNLEYQNDPTYPLTRISVGNVRTEEQTTTVPAPSAVILAVLGVGLVIGYRRRA